MSICKDRSRGVYYIRYVDKEGGERVHRSIRKKEWTLSVGLRYMRSIEGVEIAKDRRLREEAEKGHAKGMYGQAVAEWLEECSRVYKSQTAYAKSLVAKNHLIPAIGASAPLEKAISPQGAESLRKHLSQCGLGAKASNAVLQAARSLADFLETNGSIGAERCARYKRALRPFSVAAAGYFGTGRNFVDDGGSADKGAIRFSAQMRRGSELFGGLRRIDFIKCDIEGYECVVLGEMMPLIRRHRPTLLVESGGDNRRQLVAAFRREGYGPFTLGDDGREHPLDPAADDGRDIIFRYKESSEQ